MQKISGLSAVDAYAKWAIIVSAYTLGGIITRIPAGFILEKIGRRTLIVSSYILMTLAVVGLIFTDNIIILAFLFIILRSTNNIFGLSSRSLLSDIETKYKGFYNSIISTSGRFGSLIGVITLGILLEFLDPVVMIVVVIALSVLGIILFLLIFIKGEGEERQLERRYNLNEEGKTKLRFRDFTQTIFIFFFVAFTIFGVMEGLSNPLFSIYAKNNLALSESIVGILLGLANLSFIIVGPIIGFSISHRKKLIDYLLLSSAILLSLNYCLIYIFPDNVGVFTAFLFIRNAGHALFFPVVMTILTSRLSKEHFSILYSVITTAFFIGLAGTSYLSSVLYSMDYTLPWFSSLLASLVLIILITIYVLFNRKKNDESETNELDFAGLK